MPDASLPSPPRTYTDLRRAVEGALLDGQRAVERAKVNTYWETGRALDQHLLLNQTRANYGAQTIHRLAADLEISERLLYQCLQFVRTFPILHGRAEFSWAHYRLLMRLADDAERKAVTAEAIEHEWTSGELENRIRVLNYAATAAETQRGGQDPAAFAPKRGTPGVYRVVADGATLAVDLGFASYYALTGAQSAGLRAGGLVRLRAGGSVEPAEGATPADLFAYPAEILRVVDGDTFWTKIHLRPRHWLKEKLRLRAIDCPELSTAEGKAAKRFVETLVAESTAVTVTTTKPDKWDRYLSDVFLTLKSGEELFLNHHLLAEGKAVRKDSYLPADWAAE